jgi:hypothetical protein
MSMVVRTALFAADGKGLTWTRCCEKESPKAPSSLDFQCEHREKFGLATFRRKMTVAGGRQSAKNDNTAGGDRR